MLPMATVHLPMRMCLWITVMRSIIPIYRPTNKNSSKNSYQINKSKCVGVLYCVLCCVKVSIMCLLNNYKLCMICILYSIYYIFYIYM